MSGNVKSNVRPVWKRVGYNFLRELSRITALAFYRLRCSGRHYLPEHGGALVCSNHQSYFDPVIVGLCSRRRMNFLARKTLFRVAGLGALIGYLDAIPIDRDGFGLEGIKETLRRLKRREMVLIFPEGTRTRDGRVAPLRPGFCALARRTGVPLVPAAVDGAFDAWPKSARFPRLTRLHVAFGPPISSDEVAALSDDELIRELHRRIVACHGVARGQRLRRQA